MRQLQITPKYCQGFEDRHGKVRWYYRRPGFPRIALPGLPWGPDFMAAYDKAALGERLEVGASWSRPGTIGALVASYYKTGDFTGLADTTKATYRGILERFRIGHGDKRVAHLERRHVQNIITAMSDRPAAAANRRCCPSMIVSSRRPDAVYTSSWT